MRQRAFTLAEILVVVSIAGIIIISGVAPLARTVRVLADTRESFARANRERSVLNRMYQDMRGTVSLNATSVVRILHNEKLGDQANDALILWTVTPSYTSSPMGSVVYAIPQATVLTDDFEKGLYRWVLSKDGQPDRVTMDNLKLENGRLILPGVTGIAFEAMSGTSWVDTYSGAMPQAIRVTLSYEEEKEERAYEAWMPKP